MASLYDEIGRVVDCPGCSAYPARRHWATGFGLAVCAEFAQEFAGIRLQGARMVVQGFGAVGSHAARFLAERGVTLVAAADSGGAVANPQGLDLRSLLEFKVIHRTVREFPGGQPLPLDELVAVDCEIWIPAARPTCCTRTTPRGYVPSSSSRARTFPPLRSRSDAAHGRRAVGAGLHRQCRRVICGAVEYHGGSQSQAFATIREKIADNTRSVLEQARERRCCLALRPSTSRGRGLRRRCAIGAEGVDRQVPVADARR